MVNQRKEEAIQIDQGCAILGVECPLQAVQMYGSDQTTGGEVVSTRDERMAIGRPFQRPDVTGRD